MQFKISKLFLVFFASSFYLYFSLASDCATGLRAREVQSRLELLAAHSTHPKIPQVRVYYPEGFKEEEPRDVMVYLHGFGSNADSYEKKPSQGGLSVQEKISDIFKSKNAVEPVVLSFSLGPTTLAGHKDHGVSHDYFIPASDFWMALEGPLQSLPLKRQRLFFLANSGGAMNVLQMLRVIPPHLRVDAAVLVALPHFTSEGLGPDPSIVNGQSVDPVGSAVREQIKPLILSFLNDPLFKTLNPVSALDDGTLPKNIPILIQGGLSDALGYSALSQRFVETARERGYPFSIHLVPGGHASGIDNQASVDFFVRAQQGNL